MTTMASPPSDVAGAPEDSIDFATNPPCPQDAAPEQPAQPQERESTSPDMLSQPHIVYRNLQRLC